MLIAMIFSGIAASNTGIAASDTGNSTILPMLRELVALPLPHHAWPFCHRENSCTEEYMATNLPWSSQSVLKEYARITHSVSAYAGLHVYSNLTDSAIETMWEKLAAGVEGTDATIAIQLEIGKEKLGSPIRPGNTMIAQMRNATAALARANKKLGTHASIGTVMVDQEGWGASSPTVVTQNNDAVYNASALVFGKNVNIQYYGRGMASLNDWFASGFWEPAWYSLQEIDNRQLSVPLYIVPERSTMRIQYQRTVAKMRNVSAVCQSENKKRVAAGLPAKWCPNQVTPWISLGAGYKPPTDATQTHYSYTIPWDYPIWYSWEFGRDINNATIRTASTSFYQWAKTVVFYPSPFDPRSPQRGDGMTTMLLHFIAYCRGAAGDMRLPVQENI
jgi:hypothetical protein